MGVASERTEDTEAKEAAPADLVARVAPEKPKLCEFSMQMSKWVHPKHTISHVCLYLVLMASCCIGGHSARRKSRHE